MATNDSELDRLLRAAASAKRDDPASEVPFGFDTRVVAAWRASRADESPAVWEFTRLLKRIAACAVIVAAVAGAGAVWQLQENEKIDAATGGAYAMADTLIEATTWE
ncbi:MAG TPA: hypothetical protein VG095_07740 [Chthoniobacterales bacterium]|nr:hypothetical protein [Chthoniobacterales bacterium]